MIIDASSARSVKVRVLIPKSKNTVELLKDWKNKVYLITTQVTTTTIKRFR